MAADYIDYVLGEVADGPDSADIVLQDKKLTKSIVRLAVPHPP